MAYDSKKFAQPKNDSDKASSTHATKAKEHAVKSLP